MARGSQQKAEKVTNRLCSGDLIDSAEDVGGIAVDRNDSQHGSKSGSYTVGCQAPGLQPSQEAWAHRNGFGLELRVQKID